MTGKMTVKAMMELALLSEAGFSVSGSCSQKFGAIAAARGFLQVLSQESEFLRVGPEKSSFLRDSPVALRA